MSIIKTDKSATEASPADRRLEIIIGMSDGINIPFAILAGMSSAGAGQRTATLTCIAAVLVGAVAMGRSGYRAGISAMSQPINVDAYDDFTEDDEEIIKTKNFLANLGLNEEMQQKAAADMRSDREEWSKFVTEHGLQADGYTSRDALQSGFRIAIAYLLGGFIPLSPYLLTASTAMALRVAVPLTFIALLVLGFLKNSLLHVNPYSGAFRMALVGSAAAAAAFFAARLFSI